MCKGETKVSVTLRYNQPTFHDNNFHRPRWSNSPSCNNCHLLRMSTSIVISYCGSQKKRPSMQRRRQTSSSMQNLQIRSWYMQALHNVFLSFSFCELSLCSSAFRKYSVSTSMAPWRLCVKQNDWLIWKGQLKSKVDRTFDDLCLFLRLCFCIFVKCHLVWKTIISSPFRCPWSKSRPWPAISLIRSIELWNLFQSIEHGRFT